MARATEAEDDAPAESGSDCSSFCPESHAGTGICSCGSGRSGASFCRPRGEYGGDAFNRRRSDFADGCAGESPWGCDLRDAPGGSGFQAIRLGSCGADGPDDVGYAVPGLCFERRHGTLAVVAGEEQIYCWRSAVGRGDCGRDLLIALSLCVDLCGETLSSLVVGTKPSSFARPDIPFGSAQGRLRRLPYMSHSALPGRSESLDNSVNSARVRTRFCSSRYNSQVPCL